MTSRKKCGKNFSLRLPQMEYTRFPWAANEPPCPGKGYVDVARKGRFSSAFIFYALRGLIAALPPTGQGTPLPNTSHAEHPPSSPPTSPISRPHTHATSLLVSRYT